MNQQKIRSWGLWLVVGLWAALVLFAWFGPRNAISDAERRPLAQMPELSTESLLDGSFMKDFESFTLDQFPLRDTFRQLKSLFHYNALNQSDNNGIYIADGAAVKLEYPLDQASVDHAVNRFTYLWQKYLKATGSNIYMAIVPDKGYYLAQPNGYLSMDYAAMMDAFAQGMPWAAQIDLTAHLSAGDYYLTDTHWRQENLLDAAAAICEAMGVSAPRAEDFTVTALEQPF